MKSNYIIVQTTLNNQEAARKLAASLLQEKLAACIQMMPIESHYVWKEAVVTDAEILLTIKSARHLFEDIEKHILSNHPYETPEIIQIPIFHLSNRYQKWMDEVIRQG